MYESEKSRSSHRGAQESIAPFILYINTANITDKYNHWWVGTLNVPAALSDSALRIFFNHSPHVGSVSL